MGIPELWELLRGKVMLCEALRVGWTEEGPIRSRRALEGAGVACMPENRSMAAGGAGVLPGKAFQSPKSSLTLEAVAAEGPERAIEWEGEGRGASGT